MRSQRSLPFGAALAAVLAAMQTAAAQESAPDEGLEGVRVTEERIAVPAGYRVRTLRSRPPGATGRSPAVLFVQWLSCDPVTLRPGAEDGWSRMLRGLIERSGVIVARTEKPGVGGSEGPSCDRLGYDEELAAHRASLAALREAPGVHPDSIFLFGASMGGTMVPLLAAERGAVAGIIVWGATGLTWAEHLLALDRRVLELDGAEPDSIDGWIGDHLLFHARYLVTGEAPPAMASASARLAAAWDRMIGTGADHQYGRPFAFHREAQQAGWGGAWAAVDAPVLVVHGSHDWLMDPAEHRAIRDAVLRAGGAAQLVTIDGLDHHFERYATLADAFGGRDGRPDDAALEAILHGLATWRGR